MILTEIEFINGLFAVIFVTINTFVGSRIALKYIKIKEKTLLFMGISWILICSPWFSPSITFFLILMTGQGLSFEVFLLVQTLGIPAFLIVFMIAITELKYKGKQNLIVGIYTVIAVIFYIYLFYFIFTNPNELGHLDRAVDIEYTGIIRFFLVFTLLTILIFGILLAIDSLKSEKAHIRLKGKFLIVAFIAFVLGGFMDSMVPLTIITLPIIRIVLISSSILFYFGWLLPNWIKKRYNVEE